MAQGSVGSPGSRLKFTSPVSINLTMPANTYPNGTITFDNIAAQNAYWTNNSSNRQHSLTLYLCDSAGNNRVELFTVTLSGGATNTTIKSATISGATGLAGKALYLVAVQDVSEAYISLANYTAITVNTAVNNYGITVSAGTGGSVTCSHSSAAPGTTVTLTPTAATGYQFSGWTKTPGSLAISNNRFTMPGQAVTIVANFTKISYSITKSASPAAGGTVTTRANSATMGTSVTVSQTPNAGYYFNGWTKTPSNLAISGGAFTMPAANVSLVANYLKRSTATLNKSSLTGGENVTLTISPDKSTYSHKYKLSFGSGMETSLTTVNAGTTSVTITVPLNWSASIPSATSKSGGTMLVETYSGSTKIGEYTITGLTYNVPASVKPSFSASSTAIARTIGSKTYANVGDYYVQSHCGVRVQATAAGAQSSTITSLKVQIGGYSGSSYTKTVSTTSIDFTSGLLTVSGSQTITITATDSRGRTATVTKTITVTAYSPPYGGLTVRRVNNAGNPDDMGTYATYTKTSGFSAIGSNALTVTLSGGGGSVTNPANSGNILPNSRKTFNDQQAYTITMTLTDSFETVTISATLPTANYIIHVDSSGNKMGFFGAATANIPSGYDHVVQLQSNTVLVMGNQVLTATKLQQLLALIS